MARARVIREWRSGGGVLLIGYEQYRLLSMRKHPKTRRKMNANAEPVDDHKNRALFDGMYIFFYNLLLVLFTHLLGMYKN